MARFTFEGEFDMIADPQIKLVESVLQKKGFKNGKVLVEPVGKKGDNYVALVKRFIYETEDGSTFKMIGKIAPVREEVRMKMKTALMFNNEIVTYNLVLPKLNNLQNLPDINEENKVRFPICYGVVTEAPYEFILLEDLTESGFVMLDRFNPLTNESVKLVLKDLANFHSLSYVLKDNEPKIFESFANKLGNMWVLIDNQPEMRQFAEIVGNDLLNLLHHASDKQKKLVISSFALIGPNAKKIENFVKGSKYSVIRQGDCWSNNILFWLEDGKPVQDVMIDYQLACESHPAFDLLYLIFNCTDHATRLEHYSEWIDYYHETLDQSLNNHGLKANRILSKDQLDADIRRHGKLMVGLGILLSSILVRESKDVVEFKDKKLEDTMAQMTTANLDNPARSRLREKIMGIVDTAIEFGLV